MNQLKRIYEAHKQDVYQYLISLTGDPHLSEDLVSETFLAAMVALPRFRGDADIKTWLFSIARHKWYGHLRKKRPSLGLEDLAEQYWAEETGPAEEASRRELAARATALLNSQPPRVKTVVCLRVEGYSFYEIGLQLGISEGSARVMDFRVKRAIRQQLEQEGYTYE